jgi:hypothetical protein
LGRLLPLIEQATELYAFTDSFNLIHITNGTDVEVTDCNFENNIAFDGNLFVDNVDSLKITGTRFKKNMSYT